jgi:hypothetical protein
MRGILGMLLLLARADGLIRLPQGGSVRVCNTQPRVFMAAIDGTHVRTRRA